MLKSSKYFKISNHVECFNLLFQYTVFVILIRTAQKEGLQSLDFAKWTENNIITQHLSLHQLPSSLT